MVLKEVPPRESDQPEGEGTEDSTQGTASQEGLVENKGWRILVANSRGTLVNHHFCNMWTPLQEVKTAWSGRPNIQNLVN